MAVLRNLPPITDSSVCAYRDIQHPQKAYTWLNCAFKQKLSSLTKFLLAFRHHSVLVSNMTNYDPNLSRLFQALSDPTRRLTLERLAEAPQRVTDLAEPTGLRLPTVMRHLSVLEEAGLITTSKDGRTRTCSIVPDAFNPARTWLDEQRVIWEAQLDRLNAFVVDGIKENEK